MNSGYAALCQLQASGPPHYLSGPGAKLLAEPQTSSASASSDYTCISMHSPTSCHPSAISPPLMHQLSSAVGTDWFGYEHTYTLVRVICKCFVHRCEKLTGSFTFQAREICESNPDPLEYSERLHHYSHVEKSRSYFGKQPSVQLWAFWRRSRQASEFQSVHDVEG